MHDRPRSMPARSHFPGYDVLDKWSGPSWNDKTREVIAQRLAIAPEPCFFTSEQFEILTAIAARIVPQPASRPPIPVAALIDRKLHEGIMDGYRVAGMPRDGDAWRLGLKALEAEAQIAFGEGFSKLSDTQQDTLLQHAETGELRGAEWGSMLSGDFFRRRLLRDIVLAYYSHPTSWSEIGWGGPASPRGYVRLDYNERDPWEPAEARPGEETTALRINRHVR